MSKRPARRQKKPRHGAFGKWAFRLGLVAILYIVANTGICWLFFVGKRGGIYQDPAARGIQCNEVQWQNGSGQTIRGTYAETPDRPAVILAHGHRSNRGQLSPLFSSLYLHCRLGVLAFDFRGCGASDGFVTTGGTLEVDDLEGAIGFLRKKGLHERDIGLVAYDMGGVAALGAAPRVNRLGAAVIIAAGEAPRARFERAIRERGLPVHPTATLAFEMSRFLTEARLDGPDVESAWRGLGEVPLLLVAGEADTVCPPLLIRRAFRLVPGNRKRLKVFSGRDHAGLVTAEASEVGHAIRAFLAEHLSRD